MRAPLRKSVMRKSTAGPKTMQSRQQEHGIRSYCQSGLSRYGRGRPDLSLSDAKDGFFIPMVDLDLPTIKVTLDQVPSRAVNIGRQQIARLTIISRCVGRKPIWDWSNDNQPQLPSAGSSPPKNSFHDFVTDAP